MPTYWGGYDIGSILHPLSWWHQDLTPCTLANWSYSTVDVRLGWRARLPYLISVMAGLTGLVAASNVSLGLRGINAECMCMRCPFWVVFRSYLSWQAFRGSSTSHSPSGSTMATRTCSTSECSVGWAYFAGAGGSNRFVFEFRVGFCEKKSQIDL